MYWVAVGRGAPPRPPRAPPGCPQVLPMENVAGRDKVEGEGKLCERKNGRGVDPNRNWEVRGLIWSLLLA